MKNSHTLDVLLSFARKDLRVKVIDLSRNFGKEAALTAAIDYASGDAMIPIDVDLQDSPELIMVEKWHEGYEVVLAKRIDRSTDSFMKRFTAQLFYYCHNKISSPPMPENVGDFRLMDRRVTDALKTLRERHRFMKGLFAWVGFKTCVVEYTRQMRTAGKSNFNGWRLWKFALEGITSFSTFPLTMWLYLGSFISLGAFCYDMFIFLKTLILGVALPGYTSSVCMILFFGGLQLLGIGILGEYIGRTYMESKQRPIYIVRSCFQNGFQSQKEILPESSVEEE
ncbi:MAG: glycosyltransferase family 2 protein [Synergistaceae bacterium]|jgi:glycosyltransferase involved in cell wall biosynthesis|nr:glycosyltransferase family 2 protein [Synergistaceae bacterium]